MSNFAPKNDISDMPIRLNDYRFTHILAAGGIRTTRVTLASIALVAESSIYNIAV